MRQVNVHEAKTSLSKLIEAVEAGERVVIARAGEPVVEIVPLRRRPGVRVGMLKGKLAESFARQFEKPWTREQVERLLRGPIEP